MNINIKQIFNNLLCIYLIYETIRDIIMIIASRVCRNLHRMPRDHI